MFVPTAQAADDSQEIVILFPPAVIITSPARCPPPVAIVAGGRPLGVQLLVRASCRRGVLRVVMRAWFASVDSVRAYAAMTPNKAETEGAWVRRWDAAAGGGRDDWATCLRLLERAATAANAACDGLASAAASPTCVWGCLSRDEKIKKRLFLDGRRPVKHNNQPTTRARDTGDKGEEVRPVRSAGGALFDRWGRSSWAGG